MVLLTARCRNAELLQQRYFGKHLLILMLVVIVFQVSKRNKTIADPLPWDVNTAKRYFSSIPSDMVSFLHTYVNNLLLDYPGLMMIDEQIRLSYVKCFIKLAEEYERNLFTCNWTKSSLGTSHVSENHIPWLCSVVNDCSEIVTNYLLPELQDHKLSGGSSKFIGDQTEIASKSKIQMNLKMEELVSSLSTNTENSLEIVACAMFTLIEAKIPRSKMYSKWAHPSESTPVVLCEILQMLNNLLSTHELLLETYSRLRLLRICLDKILMWYLSMLKESNSLLSRTVFTKIDNERVVEDCKECQSFFCAFMEIFLPKLGFPQRAYPITYTSDNSATFLEAHGQMSPNVANEFNRLMEGLALLEHIKILCCDSVETASHARSFSCIVGMASSLSLANECKSFLVTVACIRGRIPVEMQKITDSFPTNISAVASNRTYKDKSPIELVYSSSFDLEKYLFQSFTLCTKRSDSVIVATKEDGSSTVKNNQILGIIGDVLSLKRGSDNETTQSDENPPPLSRNIDIFGGAKSVFGNIKIFNSEVKNTFRVEVSGICVRNLIRFPDVAVCEPLVSFALNNGKTFKTKKSSFQTDIEWDDNLQITYTGIKNDPSCSLTCSVYYKTSTWFDTLVGSHTVNVSDLTSKYESSETKNAFKKYDITIQPTAEALEKMGVHLKSGLYNLNVMFSLLVSE